MAKKMMMLINIFQSMLQCRRNLLGDWTARKWSEENIIDPSVNLLRLHGGCSKDSERNPSSFPSLIKWRRASKPLPPQVGGCRRMTAGMCQGGIERNLSGTNRLGSWLGRGHAWRAKGEVGDSCVCMCVSVSVPICSRSEVVGVGGGGSPSVSIVAAPRGDQCVLR